MHSGGAPQILDASAPEAFTFRSPSLDFIGDHLSAERRHNILDLGIPAGSTVDFYARFRCTLYVENLSDALDAVGKRDDDEDGPDYERLVADVLAHAPETRFDMIFGWDLINYMDPGLIHALMKRLAGSCRNNALLYILVSTAPVMPDQPAKITITPEGHMRYESDGPAERPNPRYTPLKLERMMPGFRLLHSFLLGAALQEYLFSFD